MCHQMGASDLRDLENWRPVEPDCGPLDSDRLFLAPSTAFRSAVARCYEPSDAELVHALDEFATPHLLLQRDEHCATVGQFRPLAVQLVGVITAEAHRDVRTQLVFHSGRGVGGHQGVPAVRFELAVHDAVSFRGVGCAILAEGAQRQSAAEDTDWYNSRACRALPAKLRYGFRREATRSSTGSLRTGYLAAQFDH